MGLREYDWVSFGCEMSRQLAVRGRSFWVSRLWNPWSTGLVET